MTVDEALKIIARYIPTDEYDGPYTLAGNPMSIRAEAELLAGWVVGGTKITPEGAIERVTSRRADRTKRVALAQEAFRIICDAHAHQP